MKSEAAESDLCELPATEAFKLVPVATQDVRYVFSEIKDGLQTIRDEVEGDWLVEDIYVLLVNAEAYLYMAYVDGNYAGFAVFRELVDGITNERYLEFTMAYGVPGFDVAIPGLAEGIRIAERIGVRSLRMVTTRKGWLRKAAQFQPRLRHYELEFEV